MYVPEGCSLTPLCILGETSENSACRRSLWSFFELNQTKIHLRGSTSSPQVPKRRKMCGPVSRCLGQKHVSYLLVLLVDTCTAPQLGQLFTKYKNQELFSSNTLDKKKYLSPPTSKSYVLRENRKQTWHSTDQQDWYPTQRSDYTEVKITWRIRITNWSKGTSSTLLHIQQHKMAFQTPEQKNALGIT